MVERRRWLVLFAAVMVAFVFSAPLHAQQQTVRPQLRAPQQPRAFVKRYQPQTFRQGQRRVTARANVSPRRAQPRFYGSGNADRLAQRRRPRTQARANVSPRRAQPRFYNPSAARRNTTRLRGGTNTSVTNRIRLRQVKPTFWQ
jgi:hypothetical protein